MNDLRVVVIVPEPEVSLVRVGTPVRVKLYRNSKIIDNQKIARVASSLDPTYRTMRAEIDVHNEDGSLMHGMDAHVEIAIEDHPNVVAVPLSALVREGSSIYVYAIVDGRAKRTPVKVGIDDGSYTEIVGGLDEGCQVVISGKEQLKDGVAVSVAANS
jgi:RND family efflux transporter MFP subunit